MYENPWKVENIKEFSFLNCPECPFKAKKEITFTNHAIKNHPLSSVFFGTNSDMVIIEEVEEEVPIPPDPGISDNEDSTYFGDQPETDPFSKVSTASRKKHVETIDISDSDSTNIETPRKKRKKNIDPELLHQPKKTAQR